MMRPGRGGVGASAWGDRPRMVARSYEQPASFGGAPAPGPYAQGAAASFGGQSPGGGVEIPPGSVVHVHVNCGGGQCGGGPCGGGSCGGGWPPYGFYGGGLVPTLPGLWPLPPLSLGGIPVLSPYGAYGAPDFRPSCRDAS